MVMMTVLISREHDVPGNRIKEIRKSVDLVIALNLCTIVRSHGME